MSIKLDQENIINPLEGKYNLTFLSKDIKAFFKGESGNGSLFSQSPKKNLVLFVVDGFGWNILEKMKSDLTSNENLKKLVKGSEIKKINVPFPSTTVANMTMVHTGQRPAETGMFEWRYFEPLAQKTILPIRFIIANGTKDNSLKKLIPNPNSIYPGKNIYKDLSKVGVNSYTILNAKYADSEYTSAVCEGATMNPFKDIKEIESCVESILDVSGGRKYIMIYIDILDDIAHKYGIDSGRLKEASEEVFVAITSIISKIDLDQNSIALTADHGMIDIDPAKVVYLNQLLPELINDFKVNNYKEPILPAGSSRDCFLYIKDGRLNEVSKLLSEALKDKAQVIKTSKLLEIGLFGRNFNGSKLADRIGNLVILPNPGEAIWWLDEGKKYIERKFANHGGMSREEIEVPFFEILKAD